MKNGEKYFRNYLKIAPLGLSLWRAVEARHLGKVRLQKPILDIGCGFGEFGTAFGKKLDMGIDTNPDDLAVCARSGMYKNLTYADAREMPFKNNTFGSIFSISTFEHIPHPEKVLKESYRVLKPGGILFLTLETDEVDSAKIFPKIFGKSYINSFNKMFHRHSLASKTKWVKMTESTGFVVDKTQDIISPQVTMLFDLFLVTSWPSQIVKKFTGKRVGLRPEFVNQALTWMFRSLVNEEEKEGTNLLIVARKPFAKKKRRN